MGDRRGGECSKTRESVPNCQAEWPDFPEFHSPAFPAVLAYFETNPGSVWRALRSGVWGDPRKSSAELGKKFYSWIEDGVVRHIQDVDETYRRLNVRG